MKNIYCIFIFLITFFSIETQYAKEILMYADSIQYDKDKNIVAKGNAKIISDNQIQSITISEQFAPFLGVDATWIIRKNGLITKFEFKRDRSLTMNISNFQITERICLDKNIPF